MLKLKLVKGALCSFGEDTLMSRERSSLADQLNKVTLQTLPPLSLQTMMSWELIFQEQNAVAQQAEPVQIPTPRWAELSWAELSWAELHVKVSLTTPHCSWCAVGMAASAISEGPVMSWRLVQGAPCPRPETAGTGSSTNPCDPIKG